MKTFEQVDTHVNTAVPTATADSLKGAKLKQIWAIARPVFALLAATPFIPAKWKTILSALSDGLDSLDANS